MTKASRLSLIAAICASRLAYCVASRAETREEIALTVSQDDKAQSLSAPIETGNDDFAPVNSRLQFERVKARAESEKDTILTNKERAELRADLLAYRMKQDLSRPRNQFALALVA